MLLPRWTPFDSYYVASIIEYGLLFNVFSLSEAANNTRKQLFDNFCHFREKAFINRRNFCLIRIICNLGEENM